MKIASKSLAFKRLCLQCRLPQLLEGNMPGFSFAATRYDEDARKVGCSRRVVGLLPSLPNSSDSSACVLCELLADSMYQMLHGYIRQIYRIL